MRLKALLLALSLTLTAAAISARPAAASAFDTSLDMLNATQLADAYSMARMTWKGDRAYDRMAPACARTAVREFACQGIAIAAIRLLERPSKGTMIANYVAAAAYAWYTHKAVGATILSVRF